jgi:glycosyltransferase involved in cell wall biosynthesis
MFSVIIPAFRGGRHLEAAIQSVLTQTCKDLELVVVDDASPDGVAEVVGLFSDPRLRLLRHDMNRGASAARNTGIRASRGDVVAFLDQDDLYDPARLEIHENLLTSDAAIGATYGPRYELNYSSVSIRDVWVPPEALRLSDFVLGFPLTPSDIVVRRSWLEKAGLWNETGDVHGGEITLTARLHLCGCRFADVGHVLTYRRHHTGRRHRDIAGHCQAELIAQDGILSDLRCPADVRRLRALAFFEHVLGLGVRGAHAGTRGFGLPIPA